VSVTREQVLRELGSTAEWDIIVIGGGATGLGTAVEASSRGYRTLLLEAHDFAKGTSSRSTKLVHGGVRYLRRGDVKLVLEALKERGRLLRNAAHLAHKRSFVIPAYSYWELPFYGIGLTLYDVLAGRESLGRSRLLSERGVHEALPTVISKGLKGGILYYDGQFDDARLAITLLRTLQDLGGVALNYAPVKSLLKAKDHVAGVIGDDTETGSAFEAHARAVINATGVFSDAVRRMDEPETPPILTVSQGTHIVLPREYLPGNSALMVPRTSDGRVLFAIPWHDRVVIGTTDDPVPQPSEEPKAMADERKFLLHHVEIYVGRRPSDQDIASVWSGQRPLVRQEGALSTAAVSRDHTILVSNSGLITITGGKWTTYRRMAEDVVSLAAKRAGLSAAASRTAEMRLHGSTEESLAHDQWQQVYGADLPLLSALTQADADLNARLHPSLPFRKVEVVWSVRNEMARTVEDVLARRTRSLFLDAWASIEAAPAVARIMAKELGRDAGWEESQLTEFRRVAAQYVWNS
jgi:glycerol-3-phosphate dehydrogenase